jgi:hypothetical protein
MPKKTIPGRIVAWRDGEGQRLVAALMNYIIGSSEFEDKPSQLVILALMGKLAAPIQ